MKRITALFLTLLFLCAAFVPMAAHAATMDQKLQEELSGLNFWFEAYFGEDEEVNFCRYLANEITWEFWDSVAGEEDYYIDLPSADVLAYLRQRCDEEVGLAIFNSVKEDSSGTGFSYDPETDTFRFYSGGFGGFTYNREYQGYVKDGDWYRVYYATTHQVFLYDLFYRGEISQDEYDQAIETGEFDGYDLVESMGEHYYVDEVYDTGVSYLVRFSSDGDAILGMPEYYTEEDLPEEGFKRALEIVFQPRSVSMVCGKTAKVIVGASGDGLSYKWYYKDKGASSFKLTTTFTGNTYSVEMTEARDGRQVYCVVTDIYGNSLTTDTATLRAVDSAQMAKNLESDLASLCFWNEFYSGANVLKSYYTFLKEDLLYNCEGTVDYEGFVHISAYDALERLQWRCGDGLGEKLYFAFMDGEYNGLTYDEAEHEFIGIPMAVGGGVPTSLYRGFEQVDEDTFRVYFAQLELVWLDNLLWEETITPEEYDAAVAAGTYNSYPLFVQEGMPYFVEGVSNDGVVYTVSYPEEGRVIYEIPAHYGSITTKMDHMGGAITTQPTSVQAAYGKTAKVTVGTTGEGLTYKWYYKDKGMSSFKLTTSFKGASYSVAMNEARDGREVYCVVTDELGQSIASKVAKLTMKASITTQPKSVQAAYGKTAKVTVGAEGEGLTYKWYYKDKGMSSFKRTTTFKGASYSVQMTAARSGRQVYCVVTDENGNSVTSKIVTLSMKARIATQPKSVAAAKNKTAKVTVKAEGEGLKYTWYVKKAGATKFTKSSVKTSSYSVKMTSSSANRQLYCKITDKFGNTVTSKTVSMKLK